MPDVAALGELLIDFVPAGTSASGRTLFEQNPGGAPANVLVALARLGKEGAFLGMVGEDQFGSYLSGVLEKEGIDTTGLRTTGKARTTLAFVHLDGRGDRSFSFYRNPGADMMLTAEDLACETIRMSKVFHFGSISLTAEPVRSATAAAVRLARDTGLIVSFDPNYRPSLWESPESARAGIRNQLGQVDVLKVSAEELALLADTEDSAASSKFLADEYGISIILVTLGPRGSFYRYAGGAGRVDTFRVNTVDTTGAGDAFLGGVLYWLSGLSLAEISSLSKEEFEEIIVFANAAGALTTTGKGAIPALPALAEVKRCLAQARG